MKKDFVIAVFGSQKKTAKGLGIKQPSVSMWPETLPDSAIGRIARLRPDLLRAWLDQEAKAAAKAPPPNPTDTLH